MDNEESERKNAEGISDDDLYGVCGGAENLFAYTTKKTQLSTCNH